MNDIIAKLLSDFGVAGMILVGGYLIMKVTAPKIWSIIDMNFKNSANDRLQMKEFYDRILESAEKDRNYAREERNTNTLYLQTLTSKLSDIISENTRTMAEYVETNKHVIEVIEEKSALGDKVVELLQLQNNICLQKSKI